MNQPGLRFFGAAVIIMVGIWAGVHVYLSRGAQNPGGVPVPAGQASPTDLSDSASPDAQADAAPHATIPARLPSFSLSDLKGKATAISAWTGKSLIINFWATWCAPCRREMPLLKALAGEWADRDLKVVGIAVDYRDKVQEFAEQFKIDYPLLVGEQDALDVAAQFGMDSPAFPFTVFTDQRGEVVTLFVGELRRPQAEFILSVVQNLNAGKVQLPEARNAIAQGLAAIKDKTTG
jgi:thiol-disulfide isomerase/thioredoxin